MRRKLVLLVEDLDKNTSDLITAAIKQEGASWWHWISMAWLIIDGKGRMPIWWRDRLRPLTQNRSVLVVEVPEGGSWGIHGPKKSFSWLHDKWHKNRAAES